ncbi:DUF4097 family beta strand repeat-containing protein [uncultured Lactobacillus sp.]|uniref:DUF4097 family beta strand repeat-containing protein n=1 Tax=uncultured Lactobacillus sp. TaxID=153152 RepID=UPI00260908AA|nr:DUF4097 family beta strand repeat-containing protein [uncultured Lactobacillus sp.]
MKKLTKLLFLAIVLVSGLTLTGCNKNAARSFDPGKTVKQTITTKSFSKVKADLEISDVVVKSGKSFKVVYHGASKLKPNVKISNGSLIIKQDKDLPSTISTSATRLTIVVPQGKLESISIENDAGDVDLIKGNVSKKVNIEADSGDLNVSDSQIYQAKLESDSGDITVSHTPFDGYKLEADSGEIELFDQNAENGTLKKNIHATHILHAETDSGDIAVN